MTKRPSPEALKAALADLLAATPEGRTADPADAARALAGRHGSDWGPLMTPLRRLILEMAAAGEIQIYRKGRPVGPEGLKGLYRIARRGTAGTGAVPGTGSGA